MIESLDDDLGRWEAGALSTDEVTARHPGADLRPLTLLHAQLADLVDAPTPDLDSAWARVAADLPDRQPRWSRLRRAVAAGIAVGVVAVPSVSYAASTDPVRDVMRGIGDLFGGGHDVPADPAPATDDDLDGAEEVPSSPTVLPPVTEPPAPAVSGPPLDPGGEPAEAGDVDDDQGLDGQDSDDGAGADAEQDDSADGSSSSQGGDEDSADDDGDGNRGTSDDDGGTGSDHSAGQLSDDGQGADEG